MTLFKAGRTAWRRLAVATSIDAVVPLLLVPQLERVPVTVTGYVA